MGLGSSIDLTKREFKGANKMQQSATSWYNLYFNTRISVFLSNLLHLDQGQSWASLEKRRRASSGLSQHLSDASHRLPVRTTPATLNKQVLLSCISCCDDSASYRYTLYGPGVPNRLHFDHTVGIFVQIEGQYHSYDIVCSLWCIF